MSYHCIKVTHTNGLSGYVSLVQGKFVPGFNTNRACVVWHNNLIVIAKILLKIRKRWNNIRSLNVLTFDKPLY